MKSIMLYTVLIAFVFHTSLGYGAVKNAHDTKQEYKRALDSGADAAVKHATYIDEVNLEDMASGFGDGYLDTNNIPLDKAESLKWFYEVFYGNIGVEDRPAIRESFKKFIPMKSIVEFDQISIADKTDSWIVHNKKFIIPYSGVNYLFTLSDQVQNVSTGVWTTSDNLGISEKDRQEMVAKFINNELNQFLKANITMDGNYNFGLAIDSNDPKLNLVKGTNFIVFVEGMPIPSRTAFAPMNKLYTFALGGSEVTRD